MVAIAAERQELTGLIRRCRKVKNLGWPLDFAASAVLNGRPWILLANGPGPRLASEAARAALSTLQPAGVLSMGLCGALEHTLQRCDIFVAEEVFDRAGERRYSVALPQYPGQAFKGKLLSQDRVVISLREKRELLVLGCAAVEMEAAAVASAAQERNVPFYCVRVVSDTASEALPIDFNRFRDRSGRFSRGRIATEALLHPSAVPRLLGLNRIAREAAESLGEFLVNCQF